MPNTNPFTVVELNLSSSKKSDVSQDLPYFELINRSQTHGSVRTESESLPPYFESPEDDQATALSYGKPEKKEVDIELIVTDEGYDPKTKVKIGSGAYSLVYKIQNAKTSKWAAIKEFDEDKTVENDAKILKTLTHKKKATALEGKYTVDFLDRIGLEGKFYLVMEYMPQGDLEGFLSNFKAIPKKNWGAYWKIAYPIMLHCLKGLDFIHSMGIAHRDIKPPNILLTATYEPKFCDFGLAGKLGNPAEAVGSPLYCAPEIVELHRRSQQSRGAKASVVGDLKVEASADYFALSLTFWELAARDEVYEGDMEQLYQNRVVKGERYDLPENCPVKVSTIIQSLWYQDPAKRHIPTGLDEQKDLSPK
ncbi:Serine/threonine-protein kinase StkP [Legionella rubrilucens]|uniref:Serine/threonine-protein kinase StkP n=1 Tax=Legionella rubrilucens TaxID=458 RepID=A0A0W0XW63_9GAMM|nr:protein kinase [Legionella rubrilucens]KTD48612.1 Serine/threonine-protein kinase StkP [Legionella rubrilucens]